MLLIRKEIVLLKVTIYKIYFCDKFIEFSAKIEILICLICLLIKK